MKSERIYFIYKYTFPNGKVYIGQTYKGSGRYGTRYGYRGQVVYNAIKKYPNYKKEIIDYCSISNVDEKEKFYIKKYNSMSKAFGYNREDGGNVNKIKSKETKELISFLHGGKPINQYSLKGDYIKTWRYGGIASDELDISPDRIYLCCKYKAKSAGGFQWRYDDKTNRVNIKQYEKIIHYTPVYQYAKDGKLLKRWSSVVEAESKLKLKHGLISGVLSGKHKSAGGFLWDYRAVKKEYKIDHQYKAVYQYDLNGGLICKYESVLDASKKTGIERRLISACCNNKQKSAGGFQWSNIIKQNFIYSSNERKDRAVVKYTLSGRYIKRYRTISEAAKDSNVSITAIYNCCNNKTKSSAGYHWKYCD